MKDTLYWQTDFDHSQNPFDVNPCNMALTGRMWGTLFDIVSVPLDFMQSKPSLIYSRISCPFLYLAPVLKNIPLSSSARTTMLLNYYILNCAVDFSMTLSDWAKEFCLAEKHVMSLLKFFEWPIDNTGK